MRIPGDDYAAMLCRMLRHPVVSTSANISGTPSPATFSAIAPEVIDGADYVASHRRDDIAPHTPSTIIKISSGGLFKVIRP